MAQSNVYSLNVVGYVNKVLASNLQYTAIANPLTTTNNTLAGLFGTLPNGYAVLKYDNVTTLDYVKYTKVAFGTGWSPAAGSTVTLNPGEGCLIQSPAGSSAITWTFVGDVMQATTAPLTNGMVTGLQLVGNMVPDAGPVNTLELTNSPLTSKLLKWDIVAQDWTVQYTRVAFGSGWSPSVPSIDVGESFFMNAASPFNWVRTFVVQ